MTDSDQYQTHWVLRIFTGIIFYALIILPTIIEIIIVTQLRLERRLAIISICAFLQCIIAGWAGCMLGSLLSTGRCTSMFCKTIRNFTDYRTLFTAEYLLCVLPQWFLTNIIIWFVWMSKYSIEDGQVSIVVGLFVCAPIGVYIITIIFEWMSPNGPLEPVDSDESSDYFDDA